MSETLTKLRPDRDLQCYFQLPSAIAALSATSTSGFTLSGNWRQQFDWAVVEWNRDNVFEHPQLRNLPDGDLSGLVLSYQETRVNCIQADSTLYATVDWPSLRIWADPGSGEQVYYVPLVNHATPVAGTTTQASATFTLSGSASPGDIIGLECAESHYYYTIAAGDTIDTAATQLALVVNTLSTTVSATASGAVITLTVLSGTAYSGENGKWLSAYGVVSGSGGTESWQPSAQQFSGGQSPSTWAYSLNFSELKDNDGLTIPTNKIRKMRWTYAADLQPAAFQPGEFSVVISNWSVTGTGLTYSVAGPGSRRIEDTSSALVYTGSWTTSSGNYSGGSIHFTIEPNDTCTYQFIAERTFDIYIGTRGCYNGAQLTITTDRVAAPPVSLYISGEDVLIRVPAGTVQPGSHMLTLTNTGATGTYFYLDFIELAVPSQQLPIFPTSAQTTLATDWDTYHSCAIAPERTAWLINKLGFTGRANHYVGALQFFELVRVGQAYANVTIEFGGNPVAGLTTTLSIISSGQSTGINHFHIYGDTTTTIAQAFAQDLNSGYTSVWAQANGSSLMIQARAMGTEGNDLSIGVTTGDSGLIVPALSPLTGGVDGITGGVNDTGDFCGWRTDLTAIPRLNRACRDWSTSFFEALKSYGIQATASFSTELQFGDPSAAAGIAQCYPSGNPTIVNTPALQTNFSPSSLAYWQQVYADMAQLMANAGQTPYLQFGEVQWWYFPYVPPTGSTNLAGMPFYDAYTTSQFAAKYGRPMAVITSNSANPATYPDEAQFLPALIGAFTKSIQQFVRQSQPATQFEVLYPPDTNDYSFTQVVNLPLTDWTAATLNCFKTENFTFTGNRDLDAHRRIGHLPMGLGFPADTGEPPGGISDPTTPWQKEAAMAAGVGAESVVLFALDQYCLIGYPAQLREHRRAQLHDSLTVTGCVRYVGSVSCWPSRESRKFTGCLTNRPTGSSNWLLLSP